MKRLANSFLSDRKLIFVDVAIILCVGLLVLTWFKGNFIIKVGDDVFGLSPLNDLYRNSFIWEHNFSTGVIWYTFLLSFLPSRLSMAFLQIIGVSIVISQKIYYYVLFTASGLSMYFLSSTLLKGKNNRVAALASALFYMMNPFSLSVVWQAHYTALMFAYPLLPLILLFYIKGLHGQNKLKYAILIGIATVAFSSAFMDPPEAASAIIVCFSYFLAFIIYNKNNKSKVKHAFQFTALALFLVLILSAWWSLPGAFYFQNHIAQANPVGSESSISQFTGGSASSTILNSFRLLGWYFINAKVYSDPNYSWSGVYFALPLLLIGFLIPIIAYLSLLFRPLKKTVVFFSLLSIVGIFLSKGTAPPFGGVNLWFFIHIPLATSFRAQFEKFGSIIALSFAFLIGVAFNELYVRVKTSGNSYQNKDLLRKNKLSSFIIKKLKRPALAVVVVSLLILIFVVYAFPFWTGDVIYPGGNYIPSARIQVPNYYNDAANWINNQTGDFRILSLPPRLGGFSAYNWTNGYAGSDPLEEYYFNKPIIWGNSLDNDYIQQTIGMFSNNNISLSMAKVLSSLNVKYILVHQDWDTKYAQNIPSPDFYISILNNQSGFRLERTFGKLDFYLNENWSSSEIYAVPNALIVEGDTNQLLNVVGSSNFSLSEYATFSSSQNSPFSLSDISAQTIKYDLLNISVTAYDGRANQFNWSALSGGSISARYYIGWKGVVSTNGTGDNDMIVFNSPADCPYTFPNYAQNSWGAYDSTLLYVSTNDTSVTISSILDDGKPITDIIGVWWETNWLGMNTKSVTYPIVIPPHQEAIIQINHIASALSLITVQNQTYFEPLPATNDTSITYKTINPTKYTVNINTSDPCFLVFSESYDEGWIASINGQQIPSQYHFTANGYANCWYINKTGTYTVTLEFTPQNLFYAGAVISITTLIICTAYISKNKIKNIYQKHIKKNKVSD